MTDFSDHDHAEWAAVDDALRTYPLAPTPATLRPALLARLRALTPPPRFRLRFLDYAISLFVAGMLGLGLALWQSLTPALAARLQLQILYAAQVIRFNLALFGPVAPISLALVGAAVLTGITALLLRVWPRTISA